MSLNLPNDCFVVATCAASALTDSGVDAKILRVHGYVDGKLTRHAVVVWPWEGKLRVYDWAGTMTLFKKFTMQSHPTKLAKEWHLKRKSADCKHYFQRVHKGEWV